MDCDVVELSFHVPDTEAAKVNKRVVDLKNNGYQICIKAIELGWSQIGILYKVSGSADAVAAFKLSASEVKEWGL